MRAGTLDRIIQIQSRSTGLDLYGTPMDVWTPFATIRAQKLENAADNREGARGDTSDTTITFRMRWLDGVTLEHHVTYEGRSFKITRIREIGRRICMDVNCERLGC